MPKLNPFFIKDEEGNHIFLLFGMKKLARKVPGKSAKFFNLFHSVTFWGWLVILFYPFFIEIDDVYKWHAFHQQLCLGYSFFYVLYYLYFIYSSEKIDFDPPKKDLQDYFKFLFTTKELVFWVFLSGIFTLGAYVWVFELNEVSLESILTLCGSSVVLLYSWTQLFGRIRHYFRSSP